MKFKAEKTALIAALDVVASFALGLEFFHMETSDGVITVVGSNWSQAAKSSFKAEITEAGETRLPADTFLKSSKGISADEFFFASDSQKATVKSGKSTFRVPVISHGIFPPANILTDDAISYFSIDGGILSKVASEIAFAISDDQTRPFLHGVNWSCKDGKMSFAAADGYRAARMIIDPAPEGAGGMSPITVPRLAFPKLKGNVEVELSDRFLRLTSGQVTLATKLIEGQFPDMDRITPKDNPVHVVVNRERFMAVLNRASVYIHGKYGTSIRFVAKDDEMSVSTTGDNGELIDMVDCRGHDMPGCTIAHRNLGAVVSSMTSEFVELRFKAPDAAITVHDPTDASKVCLVMPITDNQWKWSA